MGKKIPHNRECVLHCSFTSEITHQFIEVLIYFEGLMVNFEGKGKQNTHSTIMRC